MEEGEKVEGGEKELIKREKEEKGMKLGLCMKQMKDKRTTSEL